MYKIYTTNGIILKHLNYGEANLIVYVLTEELGFITSVVQAARVSRSKLKPALSDYTLSRVSLVRGKNGWKMTGAVYEKNYFFDILKTPNKKILAQLSRTILRLMPGETSHPEIFTMVKSGFEYLISVSEENLPFFEIVFMLRLLYFLGYVARENSTEDLLVNPNEWNDLVFEKVFLSKQYLISLINKALTASQL